MEREKRRSPKSYGNTLPSYLAPLVVSSIPSGQASADCVALLSALFSTWNKAPSWVRVHLGGCRCNHVVGRQKSARVMNTVRGLQLGAASLSSGFNPVI